MLSDDLISVAQGRLESGDLEQAQLLVRRALVVQPASSAALTIAGRIAVGRSAAGKALRAFAQAAAADVRHDPRSLLNLSRAQFMAGQAGPAVATARRAVELFPKEESPRGVLAFLHAANGDSQQAAASLRPGDERSIDARLAYRIAAHLAADPEHQDMALRLLARAATQPGPQLQPALAEVIRIAPANDARRLEAARRLLVLEPCRAVALDTVAADFGARSKPQRQATWLWRSCAAIPGEPERLLKAADLTARVGPARHAIAANTALLELHPSDHEVVGRVCQLYGRLRDKDAALSLGERLLEPLPADPRIWDAVAGMYKSVGAVAEARRLWPTILRRFPSYHVLHYNCSVLLDEIDDLQSAARRLRAAMVLKPDYIYASNQLALICNRNDDLGRSIRYVRRAIICDPAYANGHMNYGNFLRGAGDYGPALSLFERAESIAGDNAAVAASSRYNAGMCRLTLGELERGFSQIEARWATPSFPSPKRDIRKAIWGGPERHPGASLLLYMEQGLGDEFMMSWYLPLVRRQVRRLVVECDARLMALFSRTFEGIEFIPRLADGHPLTRDSALRFKVPAFHVPQYYVPELKQLIRANWDWGQRQGTRFPSRLAADPERLDKWRNWMQERFPGRPRIGVSWRSRLRNRDRDRQYVTVRELAAAIPAGSVAVNLQYAAENDEIAELQDLGREFGFDFVSPDTVDLMNDLEDVFAILQNSDAVVTPLISLAWMAGAAGCPGYIFRTSSEGVLWHQLGTSFLPWAPSLRVFFRRPWEPWRRTVEDVERSLKAYLRTGCRAGSVT